MANKECMIMILDVRDGADEEFKRNSVKCVAEILKEKICSAKKDYVSFVLLGTESTSNEINETENKNECLHITQFPHIQLPTWQLLIDFYKFQNADTYNAADFLDSFLVAVHMCKKAQELFKCKILRVVLFHDFNLETNCKKEYFNKITNCFLCNDIDLTVVSHNVSYIDNPEDGTKSQAVFDRIPNTYKTDAQFDFQKYALRLVSHCNATLCNFTEAFSTISKVTIKRPWTWNCKLSIGNNLEISVSGIIAVKNTQNIKLKRCWSEIGEEVTREKKYYIRGEEIDPQPEELINGYMLGGTPVQYDKELQGNDDNDQVTPGLKFVGFARIDAIPSEYYTGDSLYWIVHQRGMNGSAKKLEALVKAMHNTQMLMLCWKIYSLKFNNPKLVVLLPNKLHEGEPASLSMVELTYHAQHHFWDFPKLCTRKTECTDEQMEAINNLIDSMDLTISEKQAHDPRPTMQRDLLSTDKLPNILERNVMDVLERKIMFNAGENDEQFQKMLMDKNFVEIYWKLPEAIEEQAKRAAKKVKELFPLQRTIPILKPKIGTAMAAKKAELRSQSQVIKESLSIDESLGFDAVRTEQPADDFQQLIDRNVATLRNTTQRDVNFNFYARQLCDVINVLIFEEKPPLDVKKIRNALESYRFNTYIYETFEDYNTWIRGVKAKIVESKEDHLKEFFKNIIVEHNLGLCAVDDLLLDEQIAHEEFYALED